MKRMIIIFASTLVINAASANDASDSIPKEKESFRKTHTGAEDNFIRKKIMQESLYKKPAFIPADSPGRKRVSKGSTGKSK